MAPLSGSRPTKVCCVCGRSFAWRKRWADCWEQVKHCSAACRKRGLKPVDEGLESAIEALLRQRAGHSICPSEAARVVDPQNWKPLMEPARMAARRLARRGRLRILKQGCTIDPDAVRGPIRLAR